jgi:small subunit ribosomal protein S17e
MILDDYKDQFGGSFDDNKKILNDISTIRSKQLKNKIAGYITKLIKNEIRNNAEKENQESDQKTTVDIEVPVDTDKIESSESPKKDTDTNE